MRSENCDCRPAVPSRPSAPNQSQSDDARKQQHQCRDAGHDQPGPSFRCSGQRQHGHRPGYKVGRLQIFNNWSPYLVKDVDNTVWIGLEYFCEEGDSFWNMTDEEATKFAIQELTRMQVINGPQDVLDSHRERVKKAYPAYFDTYDRMPELVDYLDSFGNLYCVGRNGQHRYNNMDHSMATAIEAVKDIKSGETSKDNVWSVNTDKSYHEEK